MRDLLFNATGVLPGDPVCRQPRPPCGDDGGPDSGSAQCESAEGQALITPLANVTAETKEVCWGDFPELVVLPRMHQASIKNVYEIAASRL